MFSVGALSWSPLARGVLCRPAGTDSQAKRSQLDPWVNTYKGAGTEDIIDKVEEIAKKRGITIAQVAVAWSMRKEGIVAPIVGTTSLKNYEELIASVDIKLTEEEIRELEEPYQPVPVVFQHLGSRTLRAVQSVP